MCTYTERIKHQIKRFCFGSRFVMYVEEYSHTFWLGRKKYIATAIEKGCVFVTGKKYTKAVPGQW